MVRILLNEYIVKQIIIIVASIQKQLYMEANKATKKVKNSRTQSFIQNFK